MVNCEVKLTSLPMQQATEERSKGQLLNVDATNISNKRYAFLRVNGWTSEYNSVNLLLRHLARKCHSEGSRSTYLRRLYLFCLDNEGRQPDELVKTPKKMIEKWIQDHVDKFNDGEHSLRYLNNMIGLLKTFFTVNGFKGVRMLNVEGYHVPTRYRKTPEYIPKKNEVYLMADSACSLKGRAIILTLYSSGLRNSTLRALLIRDIENELSRNISNICIPVYPQMKLVDPAACKGNIPYFGFVCDEATESIMLYLRERKEKYGEISSSEPLFISEYNQIERVKRKSKILSPRQLQNIVKMAAQRAGLPQWQYVTPKSLRKAFETVLHSELIDGGRLDPKIQEFFMGHILPGSEDAYFDRTDIETLRSEYSKLSFGRVAVSNKFKILKAAVERAFQGTGIDAEKTIQEYVQMQAHGMVE